MPWVEKGLRWKGVYGNNKGRYPRGVILRGVLERGKGVVWLTESETPEGHNSAGSRDKNGVKQHKIGTELLGEMNPGWHRIAVVVIYRTAGAKEGMNEMGRGGRKKDRI